MRENFSEGCADGAGGTEIRNHGSLFFLLEHHPDTKPVHTKKRGLGWLSGGIIFFFTEEPSLLVQEIMASNWKNKKRVR